MRLLDGPRTARSGGTRVSAEPQRGAIVGMRGAMVRRRIVNRAAINLRAQGPSVRRTQRSGVAQGRSRRRLQRRSRRIVSGEEPWSCRRLGLRSDAEDPSASFRAGRSPVTRLENGPHGRTHRLEGRSVIGRAPDGRSSARGRLGETVPGTAATAARGAVWGRRRRSEATGRGVAAEPWLVTDRSAQCGQSWNWPAREPTEDSRAAHTPRWLGRAVIATAEPTRTGSPAIGTDA